MDSPVERTLLALEAELGAMVTVHDLCGLFHDAAGAPLLGPRRQSHRRCALCAAMDREPCMAHCLGRVNNLVAASDADYEVSVCPFGLAEIVLPLRRGRMHVGTLAAGLWRPAGRPAAPPPWFARSRPLAAAWRQLRPFPAARAPRLGAILAAAGNGLLALAEGLQRVEFEPRNRKEEIVHFIARHAGGPVSTADLARKLHLSPSRTGHLVSELFGVPFAELVFQERLKRAKALLRSTDSRIGEVALKAGFGSECHFSRVFRRAAGLTPGDYRHIKT